MSKKDKNDKKGTNNKPKFQKSSYWGGGANRSIGFQQGGRQIGGGYTSYNPQTNYSTGGWYNRYFGGSDKNSKKRIVTPGPDYFQRSRLNSDFKNITEQYKIEEHIFQDIFSQYYYSGNQIKYDYKDKPEQAWKLQLLKSVYDFNMKTISEKNYIVSKVISHNIVQQLLRTIEENNNLGDGKAGDNDPKSEGGDFDFNKALQNMSNFNLDQKEVQNAIDQAMDKSRKEIKDMEDSLKELGVDLSEGDITYEEIQELRRLLSAVNLNEKEIRHFVSNIVKMTTNHFSNAYKSYEESFMEADDLEELLNVEDLHPAFKFANIEDIVTETREYYNGFNIYIDISGSMSSLGYTWGGNSLSGLTLAKLLAFKMSVLGLVDEVYPFNSQVIVSRKYTAENMKKLLVLGCSGGTHIDSVIEHIRETGKPSIIITDACDSVREYSELAYFVGINGAYLGAIDPRYIDNDQGVLFNGNGTFQKATAGHNRY